MRKSLSYENQFGNMLRLGRQIAFNKYHFPGSVGAKTQLKLENSLLDLAAKTMHLVINSYLICNVLGLVNIYTYIQMPKAFLFYFKI